MPARSGDYELAEEAGPAGTVTVGSESYLLTGENLFKNGSFDDNSGSNMDQWYVGANKNGHPANGKYMRPAVNADGTLENLTPLS